MTVSNPNATATSVLPICIAGEWRLGTGERYVTRYPATDKGVIEGSIFLDMKFIK